MKDSIGIDISKDHLDVHFELANALIKADKMWEPKTA